MNTTSSKQKEAGVQFVLLYFSFLKFLISYYSMSESLQARVAYMLIPLKFDPIQESVDFIISQVD